MDPTETGMATKRGARDTPLQPGREGLGRELDALAEAARRALLAVRSGSVRSAAGESVDRFSGRHAPDAPAAGPTPDRRSPGAVVTPADWATLPALEPGTAPDLSTAAYYLNRELTWLHFNFRVLNEAEDPRVPLLERIRFIAIVGSNLDRFFMTRIGGLKQQVGAGLHERTVDGRTPLEQIDEACELVRLLEARQRRVLEQVSVELRDAGVVLTTFPDLGTAEQAILRDYYVANIYPLVTPQATDPAHPFPFVSNLSLNLLVTLRYPNEESTTLARVKVPVGAGTPRFLRLPDSRTFVTLESVMAHNLELLFPGMEVDSCEQFRVTRNANTELNEDKADDLLEMIETGLRERKFAPIVRLEVASDMHPIHRGMLATELGLDESTDVFETDGLLALRDLEEIATEVSDPTLHYPPHVPIDHPQLRTERNIFHVVRDVGSILLHFPYESFSTSVERFLRDASLDPKVRAIKMTIYRTSATSKIIEYLIDAAQNGKQVTVVVELKARFDEAANIRWANRLGQVGIHVTYGVVNLKTHCKAILVLRQDYDGLRRYAHVGTGNYHADTARFYADLGILTCSEEIGRDLTELFNYLTTGFKPKRDYRKILPAPKMLKPALLKKIAREVKHQKQGASSRIQFKMNALEDPDVTRALYEAAMAGVAIDLIIRDSCRLRPGIPGLTETVRVVSIVGRFLEHARVYYFYNRGEEEYYIGSADCMRRNLEHRVEAITPVEDPELCGELRFLLDTQLADQRNGWEMRADGSYVKRGSISDPETRGSQERLIEWAEKRFREATRLKKRRPRGIGPRQGGRPS